MTREALSLLRERRAREVFDDKGEFLGIELNYVAQPEKDYLLLPPAELPGLVFEDPNPQRKYARFHWKYA